jgi:hypothetical protein
MTQDLEAVQYVTHQLDMLKVGAQICTSVRYEIDQDFIRDELVHRLTATVLAEKLADDSYSATEQVPATWWQHWKQTQRDHRWFQWSPLRWLKPPRTRTLTVTVQWQRYGTRPYSELSAPRLGPVIYQEMVTPTRRWSE